MPRGRRPKPPENRRSRAPLRYGDWVILPKSGRKGRVPEIPAHIAVSDETRAWWVRIWRSPPATQWHPSDAYTLAGLARLKDLERKHDGGRGYASLVALIEKYENDFGLTPKGRQALRWKVEDEETIETLQADELEAHRNVRRLRAVDPDLKGANE